MMITARFTSNYNYASPEAILDWLCKCQTPVEIQACLQQLRDINYANTAGLNPHNSSHMILQALTTNNINELNAQALTNALFDPTQIIQLIEMIIRAIIIIIQYLQTLDICKKKTTVPAFDLSLQQLGANPFVNLACAKLHDAHDLTGVNLCYANLANASIGRHVTMCYANLENANLRSVNIQANMLGANLSKADLRWACIENASQCYLPALDLKTYLQSNLPNVVLLTSIDPSHVQEALETISLELNYYTPHTFKNETKLHAYHRILANNLAKLEPFISPEQGIQMANQVLDSQIYRDHRSVRFFQRASDALTPIHNRFSSHPTSRWFGSPCQSQIIDALHNFEAQSSYQHKHFSRFRR